MSELRKQIDLVKHNIHHRAKAIVFDLKADQSSKSINTDIAVEIVENLLHVIDSKKAQLTQLKSAHDKLEERVASARHLYYDNKFGEILIDTGDGSCKQIDAYNMDNDIDPTKTYALVELTPEEMEKNDE